MPVPPQPDSDLALFFVDLDGQGPDPDYRPSSQLCNLGSNLRADAGARP